MTAPRTLSWDWYDGTIPDNAVLHPTAYVETTFSFRFFRSSLPEGLRMDRASSIYLGTMFDVGARGRVSLGQFALVHGARIICDQEVRIGDHALVSWNVVLMDSYRFPPDCIRRRNALEQLGRRPDRVPIVDVPAQPIIIESNVWIGFEACILPGVTIGEGSVVGARAVVTESVPPYSVVGGNPARVLRRLDPPGDPS